MAFYVVVNSDGIEVIPALRMLSVAKMNELVGVSGEPAFFEVASHSSFSDPTITIFCDDSFASKDFKLTLLTKEGSIISGQCLILGLNQQADDYCLLRQKQVELIKREIRLIVPKT